MQVIIKCHQCDNPTENPRQHDEEWFCSELCINHYNQEMQEIQTQLDLKLKDITRADRTNMIHDIYQERKKTEYSMGTMWLEKMTDEELLTEYKNTFNKEYKGGKTNA